MTVLILGLLLFLGVHSVRIVADGWRTEQIARHGEKAWKGGYALLSLLGLAVLVWGFGLARQQPVVLWTSPTWTRHLAALLTLPAFVLLAASQIPGNALRARLGHPMLLGVKLWAFAHLLANHTLADELLFGSFLVWAVLAFRSARRRPAGTPPVVQAGRTAWAVGAGVAAWVLFAFWGHAALIGVRPFG